MGGAAARLETDAQDTPCRRSESVVGRLAIHQIADAGRRVRIGDPGTIAASLLTNDKQERDACFTRGSQPFRCRDLRRKDALRITRAAAKEQSALLTAR